MACPEIRLEGITAERYAALLAKAHAQGLALEGISGAATHQGMHFTWSYDEAAAALTIQCLEKPFFVPCSMIEAQIRSLVV